MANYGDCGVVFITFGEKAKKAASTAWLTLQQIHRGIPICKIDGLDIAPTEMTNVQKSRYAKVSMYGLSPFEKTLYLDADTLVYQSLIRGFLVLDDGWDIAIAPSEHQGDGIMWHIGDEERECTLRGLAHVPLALQGGVFFFRKNERTRAFFDAWRDEWEVWGDQDQAALLRALQRTPVKVWLLGRPWNGGAVVGHLFGRARE